jgi:uncharacterized membrane protein
VTLAPLLAAPPVIQFHAAVAALALTSGTIVLVLRKGTPKHLVFGRMFAVAMLATAISSLWITGLWPGHYSPIHILSIVTLTTVPIAILARRRGNIRAHATGMILNYVGLLIAGAFTLAPGRIMHAVVATIITF